MGPEYSCALRPELARNWSAASHRRLSSEAVAASFLEGGDPVHAQPASRLAGLLRSALAAAARSSLRSLCGKSGAVWNVVSVIGAVLPLSSCWGGDRGCYICRQTGIRCEPLLSANVRARTKRPRMHRTRSRDRMRHNGKIHGTASRWRATASGGTSQRPRRIRCGLPKSPAWGPTAGSSAPS